MRFEKIARSKGRRRLNGFTLAEVLAALTFMAIVIPVSLQAMRLAGRVGEMAFRKSEAARVAERLLNESIATDQLRSGSALSGTTQEGTTEYSWRLKTEPWQREALQVVTIQVEYQV